jgi:hypothetical protein
MQRLNTTLNSAGGWTLALTSMQQRVCVPLEEVERVIEFARRTPDLAQYSAELERVSLWFQIAKRYYQQHDPQRLSDLVEFWERYRDAVIQRFAAVTPVELRTADKVAKAIFDHFLNRIPNERIAYARDVRPLVYAGKGGIGSYFTHPAEWNRPVAIINLPHCAFDNVWQWLALAHETGHDTYATVIDLAKELEDALEERMRAAVREGELQIPAIELDLRPQGVPHVIAYSGEELIAGIWRIWANEAQADLVALLSCGGAAVLSMQQIVGFATEAPWEVQSNSAGWSDGPEVHPTPYVRNALNIVALRLMDASHAELADEIENRVVALAGPKTEITWVLGGTIPVARVPVQQMLHSAELAAEVILNHRLECLGNQSYSDLCRFCSADQETVDEMARYLLEGDLRFAQVPDGKSKPRLALAATMFAFERDPSKAEQINYLFKHFV